MPPASSGGFVRGKLADSRRGGEFGREDGGEMETLRKAAGVSSEVHIFLATGNRMKRVKWQKSGTFADLLAAHKKGESVEFSPAARI